MKVDGMLMPFANDLYDDIGQVLLWAQSIPNSGIRTGTYQVCIGLLTNGVRLRAILEGKETMEDFVKDCLEKDCPELSLEVITNNARHFLYRNYADLETIQSWLEEYDIDPEDFEGSTEDSDDGYIEFRRMLSLVESEYRNGEPVYEGMAVIEEALNRCELLSDEDKESILKAHQSFFEIQKISA